MKVITVVGARPQFIKAALVSRHLRERATEVLVHTGQHYDAGMSDIFFEELDIPRPHYQLNIGSGSHGAQTGRMLAAIEEVLLQEKPDWVLVYGDTNSTLAGALAAVKLHIPIAHVEAGLRSFNRRMPEEINRVLTDHSSDILFAPTETAVANLHQEGLPPEKVHLVGDVMYDAALYYGAKAEGTSQILTALGLRAKEYVLATIHRAENTDAPARLQAIFEGMAEAATSLPVVIPLHPRTRKTLDGSTFWKRIQSQFRVIDPVGYLDMVMLEKAARMIVTDSGGVQKEAFFHLVPCVTLRDETEWVELVRLGWNRLVPPTSASEVSRGISEALQASSGLTGAQPYGDGQSAERMARVLTGDLS